MSQSCSHPEAENEFEQSLEEVDDDLFIDDNTNRILGRREYTDRLDDVEEVAEIASDDDAFGDLPTEADVPAVPGFSFEKVREKIGPPVAYVMPWMSGAVGHILNGAPLFLAMQFGAWRMPRVIEPITQVQSSTAAGSKDVGLRAIAQRGLKKVRKTI